MAHRNVLVAGAGIAGPTLAYWLHRHGLAATVVERAPAVREGGQTVDLRGAGRTVAREMGLTTAYFTIPGEPRDGRWARWYNAPEGRVVTLRPDNRGTTRASLSFLSRPHGDEQHEKLVPEAQKQLLHRIFREAGWETARVLAAMDTAPDFCLDCVSQVRMPRWSHGRVAVLGDAGYCPSPLSGMGTSLAFTGAYALAGELAHHAHHEQAFTRYEEVLRPYAERAKDLPPGVPRVAVPRTRTGIRTLHLVLRAAALHRLAGRLNRFLVPPADTFALPSYSL
ncbi:FAD-dependent monooxygenase [Streptomyces sp. NBC_01433]|uniref:FAD-dependent monooxygenase n=1 Tax=Streptomyces sp. NBC_01433 TaxID=2903864 RepID=UPI00224F7F1B|nr:FAD-dependent monooxygenase [Streptomyces sp. NBC_01433]MCX4679095.1 FAD-dependent monooxygenase [Streptomyces sp. NBC_01433]